MTIKKSGSGWDVVHCHGKDKGKVIARHGSRLAALKQHAAIMANKKKKGKD